MFFRSWAGIGHVVLASAIVFAIIVALLRIVGQQALAKMSGFDVVFAVTLGSVVGTVVIRREIPIAEAIAALVTLLGMQEVTRVFQSRSLRVHHVVRQPPRVMLWNGQAARGPSAREQRERRAQRASGRGEQDAKLLRTRATQVEELREAGRRLAGMRARLTQASASCFARAAHAEREYAFSHRSVT